MKYWLFPIITLLLTACGTESQLTTEVSRPYSKTPVDVESCLKLSEKSKDSCLEKLAKESGDPSFCDQMSSATRRMKCQQ